MRALAVALGALALLGWAFVEWLILGPCIGRGQCTDRSWGGYYVELQALFAAAGAWAAAWLIVSATGRRPLLRPFLLLACAAASWTVVVTVR